MLDYEMDAISSVNGMKYDGRNEHNRHFHIFQIYHKLIVKKGSNHICDKRQTRYSIRQQQETMELKKCIWKDKEKVAVCAILEFPTCNGVEQPLLGGTFPGGGDCLLLQWKHNLGQWLGPVSCSS